MEGKVFKSPISKESRLYEVINPRIEIKKHVAMLNITFDNVKLGSGIIKESHTNSSIILDDSLMLKKQRLRTFAIGDGKNPGDDSILHFMLTYKDDNGYTFIVGRAPRKTGIKIRQIQILKKFGCTIRDTVVQ